MTTHLTTTFPAWKWLLAGALPSIKTSSEKNMAVNGGGPGPRKKSDVFFWPAPSLVLPGSPTPL